MLLKIMHESLSEPCRSTQAIDLHLSFRDRSVIFAALAALREAVRYTKPSLALLESLVSDAIVVCMARNEGRKDSK